ncbi:MAG: glycosyltransferase family 4 protein [Acidobacteriota bacterium]|nr:glycosyltransferase family 4 protein [Acidobacteriota bacterium]
MTAEASAVREAPSLSAPLVGVDLRSLVGGMSGVGFFTLAMLRQLAGREHVRCLGMAHRPVVVNAQEELARIGVEVDTADAPLGLLWQQFSLPRRIESREIDIFWSPLFTLPPRLEVPGVVTVHDLTPVLMPETHQLKVRLTILPFLDSTLRRASRVLADSRSTADDLRKQFPESSGKLEVVYPGVDPEFVPGTEEEIEATRAEIGCPEGFVFFASTFEPRKNLPLLLDAWEALRHEDASTPPLVLAGPEGWRSRSLMRRVRRLESSGIIHLGAMQRDRLVRLFQAARVFVLPSLYEGFGLPAAEAMACGIPTIAADTSSLPEVVGDGGLLVDPQDAGQLADVIRKVLNEPAFALEVSESGLQHISRFEWSKSACQMEEIFSILSP